MDCVTLDHNQTLNKNETFTHDCGYDLYDGCNIFTGQ